MKTFITAPSLVTAESPLPFLLGDIDQFNSASGTWDLKISTNVVEGNETASVIGDDSINEQIQKVRTTAAQAGNYVVGYAPINVIEREMEDYQWYAANHNPLPATLVSYRGRLKVSQTPVFTPEFLSYENAQFAL